MQYNVILSTTPSSLNLDETTIAEVLQAEGMISNIFYAFMRWYTTRTKLILYAWFDRRVPRLRVQGYATHMLGKWHLGHYSPRALPTARGFDSFTGYLTGEQYYWSKKVPTATRFTDFMEANASCYWPYQEEDLHDYSTFFYTNKAKKIIEDSDADTPFFLYMSYQAVHDPYDDIRHHENGIPPEYLEDEMYSQVSNSDNNSSKPQLDIHIFTLCACMLCFIVSSTFQIHSEVYGRKRRQYAMALALLDSATASIVDALREKDILDNTYIIFASDNGGCYMSGGQNGPLRGTKGSLFEGKSHPVCIYSLSS
jgi:arylsulfatase A-like enzyme